VDLPSDPADPTHPAPGIGFTERLTDRLAAFGRESVDRDNLTGGQRRWVRAAGAQGEVRHAVKEIRRLLDLGTEPERIAIVLRDPKPYRGAIATQLGRHAIPFSGIAGFRARSGRRLAALLAVIERGANLSEGERQIVCFVRALLAQPTLLIFDEATSALDYESEYIIQENMRKITKDRTVFIIAHRLAAIRNAKRIITIENGRITENGTHAQLMRKKGRYAQLYKLQSAGPTRAAAE
jgi:ABC-type multidrug transport system ATPase subunit